MKILILAVGKEKDPLSHEAVSSFLARLLRYVPVEIESVPHESSASKEGDRLLARLKKEDYVVLLDERGVDLKSEGLAELVENRMVDSIRRMIFIIGGAYGVSAPVRARANYTWKLSSLVLPHMLVRLILVEQLYRAMTILRGERYHHE